MKVAIPREVLPDEKRVALVPEGVARVSKLGHEVSVESGAGEGSAHTDADYQGAGAEIAPDAATLLRDADLVLKVRHPNTVGQESHGRFGRGTVR